MNFLCSSKAQKIPMGGLVSQSNGTIFNQGALCTAPCTEIPPEIHRLHMMMLSPLITILS